MALTYSIIIPHKDIPDLLQRCLDSIPQRDDVEVIVVDDNSDPRKVDFEHFPKWKGRHYQHVLTKEGKGAGYARNVGLDHAQGRWIIFADPDDFFTEEFNGLLDEIVDAEEDIVFFDYINVLSDDITRQVEERTYYRTFIADYLKGDKSEKCLRTSFVVPWSKIVKRELVEKNQIRFSEVKCGNDVFFSVQVGCAAKTIAVSGAIGYVVTTRKGSLSSDQCPTAAVFRIRLLEALKCDTLLKAQYGNNARSRPWLNYVYRKKGFWRCAGFCVANVFHPRVFLRTAAFLYKKMKYGEVSRT